MSRCAALAAAAADDVGVNPGIYYATDRSARVAVSNITSHGFTGDSEVRATAKTSCQRAVPQPVFCYLPSSAGLSGRRPIGRTPGHSRLDDWSLLAAAAAASALVLEAETQQSVSDRQ